MPKSAEPEGATVGAEVTRDDEKGFAAWIPESAGTDETGPGLSWDSTPPQDTGVPVSDEMIATLIGVPGESVAETVAETVDDEVVEHVEDQVELVEIPEIELVDEATEAVPFAEIAAADAEVPSIDHLLRLVRDLEYGLVELADAPQFAAAAVTSDESFDSRLLANALNDLQSEEDIAPLRESIATAQDRPRDVDVMLDLVLRADSMAQVLTERDQLKHAIELALGASQVDSTVAESDEESRSDSDESEPIAL